MIATFGRDRDRCSEIEDITIPYSNFSESIKDSWVVYFSANVPTKNAKSLTPLYSGDSEIIMGEIGIGAATIPHSNFTESIKDSWHPHSIDVGVGITNSHRTHVW